MLEIETAAIRESILSRLGESGRPVRGTELKAALLMEPEYQAQIRSKIEGRSEWARVRERWNTLGWRIQLEMAKLRLDLGDEATPTDDAPEAHSESEE